MQFMVALDLLMQPTQYALQPTRYAQCTLIAPENVQLGKLPINSFCASVWGFPRFGTSTISANFPKPLGHAVGHRGLERLMYPSEIAIGEMERHRTRMVFHLFAEKSVWRPRHAASVREIHPRPHRGKAGMFNRERWRGPSTSAAAQRLFLASPLLIIFLPTTKMYFDAIGYGWGARIGFAPNSLFRPDKADLLP